MPVVSLTAGIVSLVALSAGYVFYGRASACTQGCENILFDLFATLAVLGGLAILGAVLAFSLGRRARRHLELTSRQRQMASGGVVLAILSFVGSGILMTLFVLLVGVSNFIELLLLVGVIVVILVIMTSLAPLSGHG